MNLRFGSYDNVERNSLASWEISGWNKGEWHHVIGLYDGTYWKLYFDGIKKSETAGVGPRLKSKNVFISSSENSS